MSDKTIANLYSSQVGGLTEAQELSDWATDEYERKRQEETEWEDIDSDGRSWLPAADGSFMFLARRSRDNGYLPLVPLHSAQSYRGRNGDTKVPCISEWQKLAQSPPTREDFRQWLRNDRNSGWGYVHDRQLLVFDLDSSDVERTNATIAWLFGNIPGSYPMMRTSKMPKVQLYYRAGPGCHQEKSPEIFYSSGQTVLFAIHPKFHIPFSWRYGSPAVRHIDSLPVCNGMQQLRFLKTWGGPSGNGDNAAEYGKSNGAVKAMLAFAAANGITIMTLDDLVQVIVIAPKGARHNLAVACVSYARHTMHAEMEHIQRTLGKAYWDLLQGDPKIKKQWNDFQRLVGWAGEKVDKGE